MNNLLSDHIEDINTTIKFLEEYKTAVNNIKDLNKNTLISMLLLNQSIEDVKDKALGVLNNSKSKEIKPHLQKELDQYNEHMNNLKNLMPFLTLFFINSNPCLEDL